MASFGGCPSCQKPFEGRGFFCDEDPADEPYCENCFDSHPCGRGEHGEGCPTMVLEGE